MLKSNDSPLLQLLQITPSAESIDYIHNKKQFQLQQLVTEQRHPKTLNLSTEIQANTTRGLRSLLAIDQDITEKLQALAHNPHELAKLQQASKAIENAILKHKKIYIYGCGSTGRLALQTETTFWRPFWEKIKATPLWLKLKEHLPEVENQVIGQMTGGDRALISSLEGFEDLQLLGKLQLQANHIQKDDVVFAITEGGETSSVIGTILAAASFYTDATQAQKNLYFIYNNPDQVLLPFTRSRAVLENPAITKIPLITGPQAISGSTRMQATTIDLYVMGVLFEDALQNILKNYLSELEIASLGFQKNIDISKLLDFQPLQQAIYNLADYIKPWTELEAKTYEKHHYTTYFAKQALLAVFTDSTERSPTFHLAPLDPKNVLERKAWVQVWTPAHNSQEAWHSLLHRDFCGLEPKEYYHAALAKEVTDCYLLKVALHSLEKAGTEQQNLYDFSFGATNIKYRGPKKDDLGVLVLLGNEQTSDPEFKQWMQLFHDAGAKIVVVAVGVQSFNDNIKTFNPLLIHVPITNKNDPIGLKQQIALKMLLNAHSTAVMAKLNRIVGNTMTYVSPSNLKLIGRATFLIQSHVNDALMQTSWLDKYGKQSPITYEDANAVLFDAIRYTSESKKMCPVSEVTLAITRILESLKQNQAISWAEAEEMGSNFDKLHL